MTVDPFGITRRWRMPPPQTGATLIHRSGQVKLADGSWRRCLRAFLEDGQDTGSGYRYVDDAVDKRTQAHAQSINDMDGNRLGRSYPF